MNEKAIHKAICKYLDAQYPNVIYMSDMSGMKCTIGQAVEMKAKRCKRYKIPDLIILHPSGEYKGMAIEIKTDPSEVFTKKGDFKKNVHIQEQLKTLNRLIDLGYAAIFGCGLDHTIKAINLYFKPKK